ncbi:MAG: Lrp/AsnC family transcriptional regulator [archaeon]
MEVKLDGNDLEILRIIQNNSKKSAKQVAKEIGSLTSTVYAKIRRMEQLGIIKGYHAVLDGKKLDREVTNFLQISYSHRPRGDKIVSQREIAKKLAKFPQIQAVYIMAGEWDLLIKVKAKNLDEMGKFILDQVREVAGVDKVVSNIVYEPIKESLELEI